MGKGWTPGNSGARPWTVLLRGIIGTCGWHTGWRNRGERAPSSLEIGSFREGKVTGRRKSLCSGWENRRKDLAEKGGCLGGKFSGQGTFLIQQLLKLVQPRTCSLE